MFIIESLLPLAIIIGVIAGIVALARRRGEPGGDPGIGTVRRLYIYFLSLAGLVTAAIGATLLVSAALGALFGPKAISGENTTTALGLALTIVGTPVWLLFWRMAQRSVRQNAVEIKAASRKVYLYLVLAVSAIVASVAAIEFLQWLFKSDDFSGTPIALMLVWGGVWAFHWWTEGGEGQPTELGASVRRLYVYGLALFGMVVLALGASGVLRVAMDAAYEALFGASGVLTGYPSLWSVAMRESLASALVGGLVWWWHWHRVAAGDVDSTLRHVYLHLFAILGGTAMVVSSLSVLLYRILQWTIGSPEITSARLHFDVLPTLVSFVVVGGGLWGYHWATVRQEAAIARRGLVGARRVYSYLVSAVGLVTLSAGLVFLFAVAIGVLSPAEGDRIAGGDWWRNPLALAITLLAVGTPLWGLYWRDVQRVAVQGGAEERSALSRRVFIYLIFGISVLMVLINLSIVLFRLFDAAFGGGDSSNVLWDTRWSVGILLAAGAVSVYYWMVLKEDREATAGLERAVEPGAPEARLRKSVTVLVAEEDMPLVRRLEARLGYDVQVWRRTEGRSLAPALSDDRLAETAQQVLDADSQHIFLLVDAAGIHVVPYRD
ncbi:MAG: hypothetical protein HY672_00045 [Chloroflexi bacterium]|nr:hypothetical protein [Chloroflexota bacterium]